MKVFPSSMKYLVNDNCATFNSLLLIKFILLILWKYFVFLCFGYLEYLCFVFYWNRDTSSCCQSVLSVGVASQSLGSLSWLLGLTKAFFSNPCSYPSCVNVPWNYLRTLLAKTSQGSPQKSWKTLSVNKSKWCCRNEPHLVRLMRSRCAQGAEHNCEDVNERCGAVAPQELPLIVGGGRICEKRHIR